MNDRSLAVWLGRSAGFLASLLISCCLVSCGQGDDDSDSQDTDDDDIGMAQECRDYLECLGEMMPEAYPAAADSYGVSSECWASEDTADLCTESCVTAFEVLQEAYPDNWACIPGDPENTEDIFGTEAPWRWTVTENEGECLEITKGTALLFTTFFGDDDWVMEADSWNWHEDYGNSEMFHLECTVDGDDFTCSRESGVSLYGTFDHYWTEATGYWNLWGGGEIHLIRDIAGV